MVACAIIQAEYTIPHTVLNLPCQPSRQNGKSVSLNHRLLLFLPSQICSYNINTHISEGAQRYQSQVMKNFKHTYLMAFIVLIIVLPI